MDRRRMKILIIMVMRYIQMPNMLAMFCMVIHAFAARRDHRCILQVKSARKRFVKSESLNRIIYESDEECVAQLCMDRHTFAILCTLLRSMGRLKDTRKISVEQQAAMFLQILAHNVKNREIRMQNSWSQETISRHFNAVLVAVLRLHGILFRKPEAASANSMDAPWKWFKGCLGALGCGHLKVNVPQIDKPRYRTAKNEIATSVLGVCSQEMQFIYVLTGWEGSASDSEVLQDALHRKNGLSIPYGYYYLADAKHENGEGILTPFPGKRNHPDLWREGWTPVDHEELFNIKHSEASSVVDKCFEMVRRRWAILRSPSFFTLKIQCRIIMACCILHNLIRMEMPIDPIEQEISSEMTTPTDACGDPIPVNEEDDQWSTWRTNLALQMYNNWIENKYQE